MFYSGQKVVCIKSYYLAPPQKGDIFIVEEVLSKIINGVTKVGLVLVGIQNRFTIEGEEKYGYKSECFRPVQEQEKSELFIEDFIDITADKELKLVNKETDNGRTRRRI